MNMLEKVIHYLSNTTEEEIKKDLESVSDIGITGPNLLEFSQQLQFEIDSISSYCIPHSKFSTQFSDEFDERDNNPYDQAA